MYQYENGVKKKNVGYARVESKNGQCKITIHMQLLGQLDSIFPVYLIERGKHDMNLIYLGDSVLKSQIMDSKLMAAENNIMGTEHKLSDIGGILLFLNDSVFFATEWDDKPVLLEEVREAMKPKKVDDSPPAKLFTQKTKSTEDLDRLVNREVVDRTVENRLTTEKPAGDRPMAEVNPDAALDSMAAAVEQEIAEAAHLKHNKFYEDEMLIPKYKLPRGWKTIERLQDTFPVMAKKTEIKPIREKAEELAEGNVPEAVYVQAEEEVQEEEVQAEEEVQEDFDTAQQSKEALESIMKAIEEAEEKELEAADYQDAGAADYAQVNGSNARRRSEYEQEGHDSPAAAHFFDNYPRIYPFEDNEIILCVKIEPKDIGYLSKEAWTLSNNSFLLHGYYSYQHLIFAKMKDRFGCRYILGIPGIFHNREKFMARMFGFENFKSIRKRELRQGDFGYWYIQIPM
jgi:hypothetical protein